MGQIDQPQPQGPYPNVPPQGYPYPAQMDQQPAPQFQPGAAGSNSPYSEAYSTMAHNPAAGASSGGVTAPGGYPAAPAAGPPGTQNPGRYIPEANKPQPTGYSGPYPPQGSAAMPAPGYPVHVAPPPPGMQVVQPQQVTAGPPQGTKCGCSIGWVLFGIGWLFPICWMVAVFLPICTKNLNDRRASIASSIMLILYSILIIALSVTQTRNRTTWAG